MIGQALQAFAVACKLRISKEFRFLRVALCCTVLRSRWYQSGIKRPPVMHRGRYPTSGLSLLSPFPECEETPHLWIATLSGYRAWAEMPPMGWTKRWARLKLLLRSAALWDGSGRSRREIWAGCIVSLTTPMRSPLKASRSVSSRSLAEKASRVFLASYLLR